jgi:hypothetical protein
MLIFSSLALTVLVQQFISQEIQNGPLILFLKDTDNICGNNNSYYGLKSKLKKFPGGVFVVGSQIKSDNCKEKVLFVNYFNNKWTTVPLLALLCCFLINHYHLHLMNWYFNMQANTGSPFLSKFLYSQAIIDITLQVIYIIVLKTRFSITF